MKSREGLRSASLVEDIQQPERFALYRPTRRSLPILKAVMEPGGVTMVVAAYGTGKSMAAGVAAIAVRNTEDDRRTLEALHEAFGRVDGDFVATLREGADPEVRGAVVILTGYVEDPLGEISTALGLEDRPKSVEGLAKAMRGRAYDRVSIVWDEFGRHLEGLVGNGRSKDLDFVQRLAERVSRATAPTMSLTLLLHQNLLAYAARLGETSRNEWRKVEGRFRTLRIVEDSREIYQMVADMVMTMRPAAPSRPKVGPEIVSAVLAAGWFDKLDDRQALTSMLSSAAPLTPGALQILPYLIARIGQNERTMFSFLREADLLVTIGVEEVYLAFAEAMRTDVGIGGSYRRYIETESARSRAENQLERELLAAACIYQLGAGGERQRLSRSMLELAVWRQDLDGGSITQAVDSLLAKKLLIWRQHTDDVSIWHGADIDVSQRIREERERLASDFDLKAFLQSRFPPPKLRATGHNARFGVNRFFEGHYLSPNEILTGSVPSHDGHQGSVVYVIAGNQDELDAVSRHLTSQSNSPVGVIYVLPDRPLELENVALDVLALDALGEDQAFVASDPMVRTELDELRSVAFSQLASILQGLLNPRASAATWHSQGRQMNVTPERPGTVIASELLNSWLALTPLISNDQLMRHRVSRMTQTARVRVVGSILERSHKERLGYAAEDRSAEGSIFRTVLEQTGLYRVDEGRFADASEIDDPGLRGVYELFREFFGTPGPPGRTKILEDVIHAVSSAPFGMPAGVIPLVAAVVYRRHARAVAFYRDGVYVSDILGFQFDQMIQSPGGYEVRVLGSGDVRLNHHLGELCYAFVHERPSGDDELLERVASAIARWLGGVSEGARRSRRMDPRASALLRAIHSSSDPVRLVLSELPAIFGCESLCHEVIAGVESARKEIDGLHDVFAAEAVAVAGELFRQPGDGSHDLLTAVQDWSRCFDVAGTLDRRDLRLSDKAVLRKAAETANGRFSSKSFVGSLSSILLQRSLEKWDDRSADQFRTALREARDRLENAAMDTTHPSPELRPLVEFRMAELSEILRRIERSNDEHRGERRIGVAK